MRVSEYKGQLLNNASYLFESGIDVNVADFPERVAEVLLKMSLLSLGSAFFIGDFLVL